MGKMIAVCGSPGCGKTTAALKLAQGIYGIKKTSVIFLSPDLIVPCMAYLFPNGKDSELYSFGVVLDKTDIYKEGILSRKNESGFWEKYVGYSVDYNMGIPLGHGEKSVIMLLSWGLELIPEEMLAIRWHMNAWDMPMQSAEHKESFNAAKAKTPLVSLIQSADSLATGLLER